MPLTDDQIKKLMDAGASDAEIVSLAKETPAPASRSWGDVARDAVQGVKKFVTGGLWMDYKKALMARRPVAPASSASPSEAAQQFFLRQGFELAIQAIEQLPREIEPVETPTIPASFSDTRD